MLKKKESKNNRKKSKVVSPNDKNQIFQDIEKNIESLNSVKYNLNDKELIIGSDQSNSPKLALIRKHIS